MDDEKHDPPKITHVWPKFVLAGVVLFILLAVLWVSVVVRRTREQSEWNPLPGEQRTNVPAR